MNRLGLKISCLIVSIVIWVQVAATSDVEQSTMLPLQVAGLDEGYTLAGSDIPNQVEVMLRGSKLELLAHNYFHRYLGEVRVNVADRTPGPSFSYELASADVFTDLVVVGITRRLRLHIDHLVSRRFPVELVTEGSLKADLAFLENPQVRPDSVRVTGPERFFPDEPIVRTVPVDLGRVTVSATVTVDLVQPHELLELAVKTGEVSIRVAVLEDRTLANIPVIPLIDAGLPEVGVSPPVADVVVRGVADSVRVLTKSRFLVTVPVGSRPDGVYLLPGRVDHPDWLTYLRLEPSEFQVIVGDSDAVDEGTPTPHGEVSGD